MPSMMLAWTPIRLNLKSMVTTFDEPKRVRVKEAEIGQNDLI